MNEKDRAAEYSWLADSYGARMNERLKAEFDRRMAEGQKNVAPGTPGHQELIRLYGIDFVERLFQP